MQFADWEDAIAAAARALGSAPVLMLVSPNLSNEALFLLERLRTRLSARGFFRVSTGGEVPLPGVRDLALRSERAANATGARLMGFSEVPSLAHVPGQGEAVLVVGDDLSSLDLTLLDGAPAVVYIGTDVPDVLGAHVSVILPIANTIEEEGTLTNLRGRVQRYLQAKAAPGVARPAWYVLADLLSAAGGDAQFYRPSEVFAALAATHAPFAALDWDALGMRGATASENELSAGAAALPAGATR
jgi:NADH-quinone oxidoreductase subunit G